MKMKKIVMWPWWWAFLYLVSIPIFAFIYQCMPEKSFYHPTAQYEPSVQSESDRLLQELWKDYQTVGADDKEKCAKLAPFPSRVVDRSLRVAGDDVGFSMEFLIGAGRGLGYRITPTVTFSLSHSLDIPQLVPPGKGRPSIYKEVTVSNNPRYAGLYDSVEEQYLTGCLFQRVDNDRLPKNVIVFRIPQRTNDDLKHLAQMIGGFPPKDSSSFSRMFYLSASTITTAGFGDIVPLTMQARLTVSLEAIVGVVLIGLFLNALTTRLADR